MLSKHKAHAHQQGYTLYTHYLGRMEKSVSSPNLDARATMAMGTSMVSGGGDAAVPSTASTRLHAAQGAGFSPHCMMHPLPDYLGRGADLGFLTGAATKSGRGQLEPSETVGGAVPQEPTPSAVASGEEVALSCQDRDFVSKELKQYGYDNVYSMVSVNNP